mmetsp:Transcript_23694/g.60575  ORF Transcript_23694/g.60575 Transcript_23694/m.60575 type:complete len:167 (-) Transcript_23694:111-611(-)
MTLTYCILTRTDPTSRSTAPEPPKPAVESMGWGASAPFLPAGASASAAEPAAPRSRKPWAAMSATELLPLVRAERQRAEVAEKLLQHLRSLLAQATKKAKAGAADTVRVQALRAQLHLVASSQRRLQERQRRAPAASVAANGYAAPRIRRSLRQRPQSARAPDERS